MKSFTVFSPLAHRRAAWRLTVTAWAVFLPVVMANAQDQSPQPTQPPAQVVDPGRVAEPAPYDAELDARERVRIRHERERGEAEYKQAQVDCYQRFAVNSCLREARRARRVETDRLRKQEIALDDSKRAAEVQSRKQALEARQAERARQDAAREQEEAARARNRAPSRGNATEPTVR
ncbi:hypothetical protein ACLBKS_04755 [Hylemonella sp. W303a]|uniref:hypothetical protein n=1 Tax=Hylemonella sp. W303a TaxID=3389873 RepID=UPI00396B0EC5